MKLIILKTNLKQGLDAVSRITGDGSNSLPILKNFLLETTDNRIKLSATNLELAITCFVSGKIIEDGGLTIPLSIFNSIVTNLQSERINLETEADNLIIKTDNYEAKIQGIKKEDFPIIPAINNNKNILSVNTEFLKEALSFVSGAAQISDLRPELSGVFFDFNGNSLKFAATDSFRLAEKNLNENQFKTDINQPFKVIIPLKTINEVVRIFKNNSEKINIYFDNSQVLFRDDDLEIISRLTNGEFPDYQAIIPQEIQTEINLNKNELINALKLTSSFTDRMNEIKISVKDGAKNIEIFSSSHGLGENHYLIPAKIKGTGTEIAFNWRFLLDGLKSLNSENVVLGLNGHDKAAIIKSPGDISCFYILMPLNG